MLPGKVLLRTRHQYWRLHHKRCRRWVIDFLKMGYGQGWFVDVTYRHCVWGRFRVWSIDQSQSDEMHRKRRKKCWRRGTFADVPLLYEAPEHVGAAMAVRRLVKGFLTEAVPMAGWSLGRDRRHVPRSTAAPLTPDSHREATWGAPRIDILYYMPATTWSRNRTRTLRCCSPRPVSLSLSLSSSSSTIALLTCRRRISGRGNRSFQFSSFWASGSPRPLTVAIYGYYPPPHSWWAYHSRNWRNYTIGAAYAHPRHRPSAEAL